MKQLLIFLFVLGSFSADAQIKVIVKGGGGTVKGIDSIGVVSNSIGQYSGGVFTPRATLAVYEGTPTAGQVPVWSTTENAYVPTTISTGGGLTGVDSFYYAADGLHVIVNGWNKRLAFTDSVAAVVDLTDYAYDFDAPAQIITASNPSDFNFNLSSSFTVGFWVKALTTDVVLRFAFANATQRVWDVNIGYGGGMIYALTFSDASGNQFYRTNLADGSVNTWHYVVITYDGSGSASGINLYVNGAQSNNTPTSSGTVGTLATGTFFKIGQLSDAHQDSKDVQLDDMFVSTTALTSGQVTTLYNSGVPNVAAQSWYSSVVAFWKFNNNLSDEKGTHGGTATTPQYIVK